MTNVTKEKTKVMRAGFRHQTAIQVRFKDVDSLGHVNNANHLTYMELARMNYFKDVVTTTNDWTKTGFILAKIVVDYVEPILLDDEISVFTRCSRTGNKSFDLEYEIVKRKNDEYLLLAKGSTVLVCYNYETLKSIPINSLWVEKMKTYEGI